MAVSAAAAYYSVRGAWQAAGLSEVALPLELFKNSPFHVIVTLRQALRFLIECLIKNNITRKQKFSPFEDEKENSSTRKHC